jgi:hypothetical protein
MDMKNTLATSRCILQLLVVGSLATACEQAQQTDVVSAPGLCEPANAMLDDIQACSDLGERAAVSIDAVPQLTCFPGIRGALGCASCTPGTDNVQIQVLNSCARPSSANRIVVAHELCHASAMAAGNCTPRQDVPEQCRFLANEVDAHQCTVDFIDSIDAPDGCAWGWNVSTKNKERKRSASKASDYARNLRCCLDEAQTADASGPTSRVALAEGDDCPPICDEDQVLCNDVCTNTDNDANNCGDCGNVCPNGCADGVCIPSEPMRYRCFTHYTTDGGQTTAPVWNYDGTLRQNLYFNGGEQCSGSGYTGDGVSLASLVNVIQFPVDCVPDDWSTCADVIH